MALLAGGDVLALLLFSAIGRFSHGFSVVDIETLRTADPFIAGNMVYLIVWFFCGFVYVWLFVIMLKSMKSYKLVGFWQDGF